MCIRDSYPPVYFWYGRDDLTLNLLCWPLQGPALSKAPVSYTHLDVYKRQALEMTVTLSATMKEE